jgi:hypothetical protein
VVTTEQSTDASSRSSRAFGRPAFRAAGGLPMHSTAAGYAPLAVAGGTRRRCEICSVGRAERRCAGFAQRSTPTRACDASRVSRTKSSDRIRHPPTLSFGRQSPGRRLLLSRPKDWRAGQVGASGSVVPL